MGRFVNAPDNISPLDKIKFVGRFAEWNHKIRIENTVEKILNIEEFAKEKDSCYGQEDNGQ